MQDEAHKDIFPRQSARQRFLLPGVDELFTCLATCAARRASAVRHGPQAVFSSLGRALTAFARALPFPGVLYSAKECECQRIPLRGIPGHQALFFGQAMAFMGSCSSLHTMRRFIGRFFSLLTGTVRFQVGFQFRVVQGNHPFPVSFPFVGYIITQTFRFVNSKFKIFFDFFITADF